MIVFRITKEIYHKDLNGTGAQLFGGRWNSRGLPALYTSESRALAALELAVHLPIAIKDVSYVLCSVYLPDSSFSILDSSQLAEDWNAYPFSTQTQHLGNDFLKDGSKLALRVPSALIPQSFNYLINPRHTDFDRLKISEVETYKFDQRFIK